MEDAHEVRRPRNYDHRATHGLARVRGIREPGHGLDARRWRNKGRHVERSDASEETRGKPQAKETPGGLQAAAPGQGHELQSANDGP